MKSWRDISEGVGETWDHVLDGWRKLFRRAGHALTRYTPGKTEEAGGGQSGEIALRSAGWGVLACEVFDDNDQIMVRLEAPGMEKDDFDLQVVSGFLVVSGEKRMARERNDGGYHISECAYGRFERAIPLPDDVDSGKAKASYKRGVLRVEMPKTKPRQRIKVVVH
ncbi:MAG: Hsp20/alpha crystallin family protein [Gammaproteobacteria bacterium]|nr:Hsp20/alpha crystallin family protein [Gammaproteobacteria bacterium]